jgi:hypothetical protein
LPGLVLLITAAFLLEKQLPQAAHAIPDLPTSVSGKVITQNKAVVSGAIVQYQGTPIQVTSDQNGNFTLSGLKGKGPAVWTAWSEGH